MTTAYSRDGPPGTPRQYVTHALKRDAAALWDAIHVRGGSVFVAGSAGKMPEDVHAALRHVCVAAGGLEEAAANVYLARLERAGRYAVEAY